MNDTPMFSTDQLLAQTHWARSLARRLVADAASADDVVQQVFVAALEAQPKTDRSLRPWLETVLRNVVRKNHRGESRRVRRERAAAWIETAPAVDDIVAKAEGQRRLVDAVLQLDEPYRTTVLLRYFEDLSSAEISKRTDTPAGTVRWRLTEGLAKLENILSEEDGDPRHWCAALFPVAGLGWPAAATAGASSAVAAAAIRVSTRSSLKTAITGWLVMKSIWITAAALVAALIWFNPFGWGPTSPPTQRSADSVASATSARSAATPAAPDTPIGNPRTQADPSPIAPDLPNQPNREPTQSNQLRVRLVDPTGQGVAGVRSLRASKSDSQQSDRQGDFSVQLSRERTLHYTIDLVHPQFANVTRRIDLGEVAAGATLDLGTIQLVPGATVSGRVIDDSGQPVANAGVEVEGTGESAKVTGLFAMSMMSQDRTGRASTTTDNQGRFRLTGVMPGRVEISAHHSAARHFVDHLEGQATATAVAHQDTAVEIQVARSVASEAVVEIEILDPDGQPVPHAHCSYRSNRGGNGGTSADDAGTIRLGDQRNSRFDLVIKDPKERWGPITRKQIGGGQSITLQFEAPVLLTVPVRSSDPALELTEVHVTVRTAPKLGLFASLTGGRGRPGDELQSGTFKLRDAAIEIRQPAERFEIAINAPGHEDHTFGPFQSEDLAGLDLVLERCSVVRGQVLANGAPIANATVTLHQRPQYSTTHNGFAVWLDPQSLGSTSTDEAGRFELPIRAARSWVVRVAAEGFAIAESAEHGADVGNTELSMTLDQGGSIHGRLTLAAGQSLHGSIVAASRGDGAARTVRVGADGAYRFDRLTPGRYLIQQTGAAISPTSSSSSSSLGAPIRSIEGNCEVFAGQETLFDIGTTAVADARLSGIARLGDQLLNGALVKLEPLDVPDGQFALRSYTATIGANGSFEIPALVPDRYSLRIKADRYIVESVVGIDAGDNSWKLEVETSATTIADLPPQGENPVFSMQTMFLTWSESGTTIRQPFEPGSSGSVTVADVPVGKVLLQRTPQTETELFRAMVSQPDQPLITVQELTVR